MVFPSLPFPPTPNVRLLENALVSVVPDSRYFRNILGAPLTGGTGVERLEHNVNDPLRG